MLILWSNLAQTYFDLVKSSNCYAPSKLSFKWFATDLIKSKNFRAKLLHKKDLF